VLAGNVDFIDPLDGTGFFGLGGAGLLSSTAAPVASALPFGGTLTSLYVHSDTVAIPGGVAVTVLRNGIATSITCTIPNSAAACTATGTVVFTAGDTVTLKVVKTGGSALQHLGVTMGYQG
jgi:hypothetical protein